jgi:hypothetical protein
MLLLVDYTRVKFLYPEIYKKNWKLIFLHSLCCQGVNTDKLQGGQFFEET